jgi:guanine deaminase
VSGAAAAHDGRPATPDRLLVLNGLVLADADQPARPADLLIEDGLVREIGRPGAFIGAPATRTLDATDRLVMPGWVNGHTHGHGTLGRGAVPDVALEGFLAASPAINGHRGLDDLALSATLTAVELLKKGCTALFDMSAELPLPTPDGLLALAGAYDTTGIRAVVAPMLADRTLYQAYPELLASLPAQLQPALARLRAADADTCLAVVRQAARHWPFDQRRVRLGIAPTIPLHCTDAFLQGCAALAIEFGLPLQTHLAESAVQAHVGQQRHGRSLVAHLGALGWLDGLGERLSVAHAIWVSDDDIEALARAGATAVHNPLSNLRLGSGIAPVRRMLDRGLPVGLGSDGANTSDTQNLFEAARLAVGLSRIVGADESRWLNATDALRMGTEHSARALGWGGQIGRIAPGCCADLVLLDLTRPEYVPLRDPLRQLVHGESGAAVDRVLVGGRLVVDRGRVLTVDEPALRRQAQAAAERLDALNADGCHLAAALRPGVSAFCCGVGRAWSGALRRLPD